jgi:ABC-2 type transport system permease protein
MAHIPKLLLPVAVFARIDIKRLFRDKVAIFFVFVFPLIFLLIFGSIFNGENVSFRVALMNESSTPFAKQFAKQFTQNDVFKVDAEVTSMALAKEKMNRGQLDATIILPKDFGAVSPGVPYPSGTAKIVYDKSSETAGTTLAAVIKDTLDTINNKLVPTNVAPFKVVAVSTATKGLTQFDYTFSGILGFTLLSLGVFGPANVFPRLKQRGVLRRYRTTTLKVWQYFTGNVISNMFVGLLAVALMFSVALTVFDLNMRGNYAVLAVVTLMGTILLFGIGLAIGGWAKNENQAAPLTQLVTLPMMFLSGVFFPVFLMPEFLQSITKFIPLTPIIDSIRLVITENASLVDLAPQLGIMTAWLIAIYALAFSLFRWE